jgi:hypothetical protein
MHVDDSNWMGDPNVVYRAVRASGLRLGTLEAPCGACPVFSFCSEKGPVNPKGCEYYDKWLDGPVGEDQQKEANGDADDVKPETGVNRSEMGSLATNHAHV